MSCASEINKPLSVLDGAGEQMSFTRDHRLDPAHDHCTTTARCCASSLRWRWHWRSRRHRWHRRRMVLIIGLHRRRRGHAGLPLCRTWTRRRSPASSAYVTREVAPLVMGLALSATVGWLHRPVGSHMYPPRRSTRSRSWPSVGPVPGRHSRDRRLRRRHPAVRAGLPFASMGLRTINTVFNGQSTVATTTTSACSYHPKTCCGPSASSSPS